MTVAITRLTTEHQIEPLGIDETHPLLGWQIASTDRNVTQISYRVRAAATPEALAAGELVWDSGRVLSSQSIDVTWGGPALRSRQRCYWDVEVETTAGAARASEPTWFEMGLLAPEDWVASWGRPDQEVRVANPPHYDLGPLDTKLTLPIPEEILRPAQYIRRSFDVNREVVRARIYATAHGVYRLELNGSRVGDRELAPEWTSYHERLQYQTYDVTDLLTSGENVLGMVLADGWWAGRLGVYGEAVNYGKEIEGLWQLEIELSDGSRDTICLDREAKSHEGPIRYSDLMIGERIDHRRCMEGWSAAGFDDSQWAQIQYIDRPLDELVAAEGEPVRVIERFPAQRILTTPAGETVVDFGRVMAGHASARLNGAEGDVLRLEYTQSLDENGNFFANIGLRPFATPTDTFVLNGNGEETFDPSFTYRGFRYVRVTGTSSLIETLQADCFQAVSLSSDTPETLRLSTSNENINALVRNIKATHRANMLSIPTDNPDRERAGWTGDFHAIAPSIMATSNLQTFTRRWLKDAIADQRSDGGVPQVIPVIPHFFKTPLYAWGDVSILGPWEAYAAYGDRRLLEETHELARGWMRWSHRQALASQSDADRADPRLSHVWRPTEFGFGDWLTPSMFREIGDRSPANNGQVVSMIPTLYWYRSASIMACIASVLGLGDEVREYTDLAKKISESFTAAFVREDGTLTEDMQANYVLAIRFGLGSEELRAVWFDRLVTLIEENGGRLDTGFLSTAHLLPVLTEGGRGDLATSIFLSQEYPSWLYMVRHGATSVWESWSAVDPGDGHVLRASFIQPGLTTVLAWMTRYLGGLAPAGPGFKQIAVQPVLDARIPRINAEQETPYGPVGVNVELDGHEWTVDVELPANTSGVLAIPVLAGVIVDGAPVAGMPADASGRPILGSGSHRITVPVLV